MAISAVNAGSNAIQQQQLQFSAMKDAPQQEAPRTRENSENANAREAQAAVRSSPPPDRQQDATRVQRQEASKPVVNAQGQKTGTIINTTA